MGSVADTRDGADRAGKTNRAGEGGWAAETNQIGRAFHSEIRDPKRWPTGRCAENDSNSVGWGFGNYMLDLVAGRGRSGEATMLFV